MLVQQEQNKNSRRRSSRFSTKQEWIVAELRDAIMSGELEPGQRIMELELAEQYAVSATPVREAIRQLLAEGLLSSEPHRGVRVAESNIDATRERYLIRIALEQLAVKLAMEHPQDIPLAELNRMLDDMDRYLSEENWSELRALHWKFHSALYRAARAPNLHKMLNQIWIRLPWDRNESIPGRAPQILEEHRAIVAAFAAGDEERAAETVRQHLTNAMNAFLTFTHQTHSLAPQSEAEPSE